MMELIKNQLIAFTSILNILYSVGVLVGVYFYGKGLYRKAQKEYIYVDFKLSAFELSFLKDFSFYFIWALVQQSIVLYVVSLVPWHFMIHNADISSYVIATVFFSVICHLPNWLLVKNTFLLGILIYFAYYILGYNSIIWMAIIHGFGGTVIKKLGYDMRVWRGLW
jgi:hypothetical protein